VAPTVERYIARKVVKARQPDFVYANTVLTSEYIAAARRFGIPSVLHVWEQEPLTSWAFARAKLDPRRLVVITPSDFVAAEMEGLSASVISVLPGPLKEQQPSRIAPDDLPWSEGVYRVIACGSVAPWKGTAEFLEAASRLQSIDGRPVEWAWVGGGPDLAELREETLRHGTPVRWLGERADAAPYLQAADALVLPSRQETLGLVVLEAAALGTPTIAFAVGGVPSIVRDRRALATPGDVTDLVTKLRALLPSGSLRLQLLRSSRAAVVEASAERWRERLSESIVAAMQGSAYV
jgi:glycosyltransferase involved in cell wall biosynthesis